MDMNAEHTADSAIVNPMHGGHGRAHGQEIELTAVIGSASPDSTAGAAESACTEPPAGETAAAEGLQTAAAALPPPHSWCALSSFATIILLACVFVDLAFYIMMQGLPEHIDTAAQLDNALDWIDRGHFVAVTWCIVIFVAVLSFYVIARVTCCWRSSVRDFNSYNPAETALTSKHTFTVIRATLDYYTSARSPHFLRIMFFSEVNEFIWQALAVSEMADGGHPLPSLIAYTTSILLNAASPLVLAWITWTGNTRAAADRVADPGWTVRWISRVLLFDAAMDIMYASFGIFDLSISSWALFYNENLPISKFADNYAHYFDVTPRLMKAAISAIKDRAVLFGGRGFYDIILTFFARVLPLILAPLRLRLAFLTRRQDPTIKRETLTLRRRRRSTHLQQDGAPGAQRQKPRTKRLGSVVRGHIGSMVASDHASSQAADDDGEEKDTGTVEIQQARPRTARARLVFYAVPVWAAAALAATAFTFAVIVYARLGTWGDCENTAARESCARRSFPIFQAYGSPNSACACSILFVNDSATCYQVTENNSHTLTFASASLNESMIWRFMTYAFVIACPLDTPRILSTISTHAERPVGLYLTAVRPSRCFTDGNTHTDPYVLGPKQGNWTERLSSRQIPFGFGRSPSGKSWPLVYLVITRLGISDIPEDIFADDDKQTPGLGDSLLQLDLSHNFLSSLPAEPIGRLTRLRTLLLDNNPLLASIPESVPRLTNLRLLKVSSGSLVGIPSNIGLLTKLDYLDLSNNFVHELPPSMGKLQALRVLYLQNNELHSFNSTFDHLSEMRLLSLASQSEYIEVSYPPFWDTLPTLTDFSVRFDNLQKLVDLSLEDNLFLTSIPSSMAPLTRLRLLFLGHTGLDAAPDSVWSLPQPLYMSLEHNWLDASKMSLAQSRIAGEPGRAGAPLDPRSVATVGAAPGMHTWCDSMQQDEVAVGPWRLRCKLECALSCVETGLISEDEQHPDTPNRPERWWVFGLLPEWNYRSFLNNALCDPACNNKACGWETNDCTRCGEHRGDSWDVLAAPSP